MSSALRVLKVSEMVAPARPNSNQGDAGKGKPDTLYAGKPERDQTFHMSAIGNILRVPYLYMSPMSVGVVGLNLNCLLDEMSVVDETVVFTHAVAATKVYPLLPSAPSQTCLF